MIGITEASFFKATCLFGFLAFAILFAEASTPYDGIPAIVKELGAVGALIWYMYYNTQHAIPRIVKENNETAKIVASETRATVKDLSDSFKNEMQTQRAFHIEQTKLILENTPRSDSK